MRRNILARPGLRLTTIIGIAAAVALGGAGAAADASGGHAGAPPAPLVCAKVIVTATPKLNTQAGSTETLRTTIKSCAPKFEVIKLRQRMSIRGVVSATVQLFRHEKVEITQNIKYRCCGTFTVTDRALSNSGKLLSKAKATWTFA